MNYCDKIKAKNEMAMENIESGTCLRQPTFVKFEGRGVV
jgi:hypothetical protein